MKVKQLRKKQAHSRGCSLDTDHKGPCVLIRQHGRPEPPPGFGEISELELEEAYREGRFPVPQPHQDAKKGCSLPRPALRGGGKVSKGLKVSEHDIQRQILDFLRAKGIFAERRNVVAPMLPGKGGKLQPVRSGSRGAADIWGILPKSTCCGSPTCSLSKSIGHHFEIEVKTPDWKPPKFHFTLTGKVNKAYVHWQEQLAWGAAVKRAGGIWAICQSLEEAREILGI